MSLRDKMSVLVTQGLLTPRLQRLAHRIRLVRNQAAHPDGRPFPSRQELLQLVADLKSAIAEAKAEAKSQAKTLLPPSHVKPGALQSTPSASAGACTFEERIELNCPFQDKEQAKALGARWDPTRRKWYVNAGMDLHPFRQWMPH